MKLHIKFWCLKDEIAIRPRKKIILEKKPEIS